MSEKAFERLLGEIRRLADKVDSLDARLRGLEESEPVREAEAAAAAPATPAEAQLRDGPFGPVVRRSDPSRHRKAVSQALAMLGVIPDAQASKATSSPSRQRGKHESAIERIRRMQNSSGSAQVPSPQAEGIEASEPSEADAATDAARTVTAVAVAEAEPQVEAPAPGSESPERSEEAPGSASDPALRWETAGTPAEQEDSIDLSAAVAVDLARTVTSERRRGMALLVLEVLVAGLILGFAGNWNSIPFLMVLLAVLVAPVWGSSTYILRAHARLFTLVLLARCLLPDFLSERPATAWLNPRFGAMMLATLPGWILVVRATVGWGVAGSMMSVVVGVAVGLESGSVTAALVAMVACVGATLLLRRAVRKSF